MSLFGQTKRHVPSAKPRRSPLPVFSGDAEKYTLSGSASLSASRWYTVVAVPVPRIPFWDRDAPYVNGSAGPFSPSKSYYAHPLKKPRSHLRILVPVPPRVYARLVRLNGTARLVLGLAVLLLLGIVALGFRKTSRGRSTWSPPFVDPDTMVITPDEAAAIWEWEVLSGHHPSLQNIPEHIPVRTKLLNPALPESFSPPPLSHDALVAYQRSPHKSALVGAGPARQYLPVGAVPVSGYTPRPTPGGVLDLDVILEKCDFGTNKYVRDCLEVLRIGGNMDNGRHVRRGNYVGSYKQIYLEAPFEPPHIAWTPKESHGLRSPALSRASLSLPPPFPVAPIYSADDPCDPQRPRLFHMFWAGPFTDKPYMAVMSFLYTQNLGLDKPLASQSPIVKATCRPEFWVWINPGPAAAVPNPSAERELYQSLATNPWSAPFLHERFRDVVKFKMWNTTEQLDGVDELRPYWRDMPIFNSGGNTYKQASPQATAAVPRDVPEVIEEVDNEHDDALEAESVDAATTAKKNSIFEKVGSASESDYDRLSVILSDMARFVLTHRFGGIYLDADTIFLRDWEELWNYRGQFAYRWSWHQKYNTAVLKLHKGSALSAFLFKTALENGLDFHPMTVSRYLKDAGLDKLLFRIPDALFDPAWLNMERYQRERPPFPYFAEFSVFFSNDKFDTAGPHPLGFDGFFRGAYSYHFHNFWWLPFDPSRNWPDLGQRFVKGENAIKDRLKASHIGTNETGTIVTSREDMDDEVDLSWSTVLKRTFEGYVRAERPNMYGEWLAW